MFGTTRKLLALLAAGVLGLGCSSGGGNQNGELKTEAARTADAGEEAAGAEAAASTEDALASALGGTAAQEVLATGQLAGNSSLAQVSDCVAVAFSLLPAPTLTLDFSDCPDQDGVVTITSAGLGTGAFTVQFQDLVVGDTHVAGTATVTREAQGFSISTGATPLVITKGALAQSAGVPVSITTAQVVFDTAAGTLTVVGRGTFTVGSVTGEFFWGGPDGSDPITRTLPVADCPCPVGGRISVTVGITFSDLDLTFELEDFTVVCNEVNPAQVTGVVHFIFGPECGQVTVEAQLDQETSVTCTVSKEDVCAFLLGPDATPQAIAFCETQSDDLTVTITAAQIRAAILEAIGDELPAGICPRLTSLLQAAPTVANTEPEARAAAAIGAALDALAFIAGNERVAEFLGSGTILSLLTGPSADCIGITLDRGALGDPDDNRIDLDLTACANANGTVSIQGEGEGSLSITFESDFQIGNAQLAGAVTVTRTGAPGSGEFDIGSAGGLVFQRQGNPAFDTNLTIDTMTVTIGEDSLTTSGSGTYANGPVNGTLAWGDGVQNPAGPLDFQLPIEDCPCPISGKIEVSIVADLSGIDLTFLESDLDVDCELDTDSISATATFTFSEPCGTVTQDIQYAGPVEIVCNVDVTALCALLDVDNDPRAKALCAALSDQETTTINISGAQIRDKILEAFDGEIPDGICPRLTNG